MSKAAELWRFMFLKWRQTAILDFTEVKFEGILRKIMTSPS